MQLHYIIPLPLRRHEIQLELETVILFQRYCCHIRIETAVYNYHSKLKNI